MAKQEEILAAIRSHPEGVDLATLAAEFGVKQFLLTRGLSDLKKKGTITHIDGIYQAAQAEVKAEKPAAEKPDMETPLLPTDYSEFSKIGESIGVSGDFLKSICDYIFRGDPYSIETVHEALRGLHLRPDIIARWTQMWAAAIGKPAPKGIEETAATTTSPLQKKWIILGNKPVPDENGPYSFHEALQVIETQSRGQPEGGNEELRVLREELRALRDRIEAERYNTLSSALTSLNSKVEALAGQKQLEGRFAIMDKGLDKIGAGAEGIRGDLKPILENMVLKGGPLPRKRTAEEKAGFSEGLDKGIAYEMELREMEDHLFFGKDPGKTKTPQAPPPVPKASVSYE